MVNFGFNSASVLGIVLALAGAGLYLMRSLRPEVSRDHDIFFAAVGLLCGFILFFQGWRLDPILQFSQLLLSGSAIFFAVETIRLRGATNEKVRGSRGGNSYVDDDRPVNRPVYRAQLDQNEGFDDDYYEEEEVPRRRLQGTAVRTPRPSSYEEETPPRRSRPRRPSGGYGAEPPPANRSRSSSRTRPSRSNYEDWQQTPDHWDDEPVSPRQGYSRPRSDGNVPPSPSRTQKKRRPKSAEDIVSSVGTEYVDYQPIEPENPNYDDTPRGDRPSNPDNFDY